MDFSACCGATLDEGRCLACGTSAELLAIEGGGGHFTEHAIESGHIPMALSAPSYNAAVCRQCQTLHALRPGPFRIQSRMFGSSAAQATYSPTAGSATASAW